MYPDVFRTGVPINEMEHLEGKIIVTPNGETVIDFGQNIAGYVEFTLEAKGGETIVLTLVKL